MKINKRDSILNIRVPKAIKKFYKTLSIKSGRTLSDIINEILETDVENRDE